MMRRALAALVMAVAIAGGAVSARANLVINPGFEADDIAFTTLSTTVLTSNPNSPFNLYPSAWTDSGNVGVVNTFSNSGLASAFSGNGGSLSQTLTTAPGATYNISFYVGVDDSDLGTDVNAIFDATFGGTGLLPFASLANPSLLEGVTGQDVGPAVGNAGFEQFTASVVASGNSTTLTFTGSTTGSDGPWYLDDVDVEPATTAPEPSSLLLLLAAIAALPLLRRHAV